MCRRLVQWQSDVQAMCVWSGCLLLIHLNHTITHVSGAFLFQIKTNSRSCGNNPRNTVMSVSTKYFSGNTLTHINLHQDLSDMIKPILLSVNIYWYSSSLVLIFWNVTWTVLGLHVFIYTIHLIWRWKVKYIMISTSFTLIKPNWLLFTEIIHCMIFLVFI